MRADPFCPRSWLAIALVLAVGGGIGCASAGRPPDGPEAPVVGLIRWEGVEGVKQAQLESLLRTRRETWTPFGAPDPFDESLLAEDLDRLEEAYRQEGYYEADVEADVEHGDDPTSVVIRFRISEGAPVRIAARDVEILGTADPHWPADAAHDLPGAIGEVFRLSDYRAAKNQLLERFARAGFPDAALEGGADLDLDLGEARIAWAVQPGPRVVIGAVQIVGLATTQESVVRARVDLARSEPLDPKRLEQTRDQVFGLGVFESVAVVPLRGAAPDPAATEVRRDIEVRVKERPPRTFEAAIGYATDERVRGRLGWRHRNVSGLGATVGGQLRASFLGARAEAFTEWPGFPNPETMAFSKLGLGTEQLETYDADEARVEFGVRRSFMGFDATVRYAYEWARIHNVSDAAKLVLDEPERTTRLSLLGVQFIRDRRDDPLQPTRGIRLRLNTDLSPTLLGSDISFLRLGGEVRAYYPIGGTVLAGRLTVGVIQPFGTSRANDIPLTQRYFAGGGDSVRGYRYQHLGPRDASDDPLGGTTLVTSSLEWRFPVWRDFGGVAFVDMGEVGLEPFDLRGDELRIAAGGGLRYTTPVGPIRLDVGVPLNRPDDSSSYRIHLSIGHAF